MTQHALNFYPSSPGWKARSTSHAAAIAMKPRAPLVRERVLNALRQYGPCTPDECANIIHLPILTVRPRFSELAADGLIFDTLKRRMNDSMRRAIVWGLA